ncbi:TetR/AcrR family transcriptional regulator [Ferrovibrio sp.]|uniref:TetR/AcrR family transcriptional regulator n=1 Tax=Ferrovibrio sp. TaxID=1917215 RepID=UPI001B6398BC|nr:TetR/AcrR family transcriptional regulator [Ferrovibrio sp.]MBP7066133.1 TetR/AcrR family transcriptional regulator [Ferrovibrio sp.]
MARGRQAAKSAGRIEGAVVEIGRADTRLRILSAAAAELVAGDGVMEIGDVARRAGISVGLSYHYFGSKAGLVAALVEDFYDRYDARVMAVNPQPGADWGRREKLRLEAMVAFHYAEPLAPIVLARLNREPEVAAVEARRLQQHIELAAHNIALAQLRGEIPLRLDPHLLGAMILGGLRQATGQALAQPERPDQARLAAQLWDFIAGMAQFKTAGQGENG